MTVAATVFSPLVHLTLAHFAWSTPGTACILGIRVAGVSFGGQGVLVAGDPVAAPFYFRVLAPVMHWPPALVPAVFAGSTVIPGEIPPALGFCHRLDILAFPVGFRPFSELFGIDSQMCTFLFFFRILLHTIILFLLNLLNLLLLLILGGLTLSDNQEDKKAEDEQPGELHTEPVAP